MQGADTAANAQAFGAVITDLDATNLASVTVSTPAAQIKDGDRLLIGDANVALDMSQAAVAQSVSVGTPAKAFFCFYSGRWF